MTDATERTRRIYDRVLHTNRNKGVDVLVNKLDFLWFFERAEEAERENERFRRRIVGLEKKNERLRRELKQCGDTARELLASTLAENERLREELRLREQSQIRDTGGESDENQ